MDILNKHYEKFILALCMLLMIWGLLNVSSIVGEAKDTKRDDDQRQVSKLNTSAGDLVSVFNTKLEDSDVKGGEKAKIAVISKVIKEKFKSSEEWIQRIKENQIQKVVTIDASANAVANPDEIKAKWDRRYFSILTKHSQKPIEFAEIEYRLKKQQTELAADQKYLAESKQRSEQRKDDEEYVKQQAQVIKDTEERIANLTAEIASLQKRLGYLKNYCTAHGSLVDPQEIICCTNADCAALISSTTEKCPFCSTQQPMINPAEDDADDLDGDGLPDSYERNHMKKHHVVATEYNNTGRGGMGPDAMGGNDTTNANQNVLSPNNQADAYMDFDGDTFVNIEEFRFGTDIDYQDDHPDPLQYVRFLDFTQKKFAYKFIRIDKGNKGQKPQKEWRPVFVRLMQNGKYATGEKNEERVHVGKKLEDRTTGQKYTVEEMGEENGRNFVRLKEYFPPKKKSKLAKSATPEPEEEVKEAKVFTLYEGEEKMLDAWYADIVFFASRNYSLIDDMMDNYYNVYVNGKRTKITTRFLVTANDTITLELPFSKPIEKKADDTDQYTTATRRGRRQAGGRGLMDEGMGTDRLSNEPRYEITINKFEYKVTAFDPQAKSLTLTPVNAGKAGVALTIPKYKENETYTLPSGRVMPLFYNGNGEGRLGGGPMDEGPGGGRMGGPRDDMGSRGRKGGPRD